MIFKRHTQKTHPVENKRKNVKMGMNTFPSPQCCIKFSVKTYSTIFNEAFRIRHSKKGLLQLQKCLLKHRTKNPSAQIHRNLSLVPFFPSELQESPTSSKGRRCHETMPTRERVRSLELRPSSLETNGDRAYFQGEPMKLQECV